MASKLEISYIYIVQCPIDDTIKYLSSGISPHVPQIIERSYLFKEWKKKLKELKLKPRYLIVEKVLRQDEKFWLTHYQDLFTCWGYTLWTDAIDQYIKEASKFKTTELKQYLNSTACIPNLKRKVLNLENLVRIIKSLLGDFILSKILHEFSLITIFIFFYGKSLSQLSKLKTSDLWKFLKECGRSHPLLRFEKLEIIIHRYGAVYLPDLRRRTDDSKVFSSVPSAKEYNSKLNGILSYFGFDQNFNYHDRALISQLLLFKTNALSKPDRILLEEILRIEQKQLLYELINRTKSKYVIISENSQIYREVLSCD